MKCDKLQQVENPIEWGLYYDKNEVDAAIAELKAENRKLNDLVYLKSEADKVIALLKDKANYNEYAYKRKSEELADTCRFYEEELRHHKHKRCFALAQVLEHVCPITNRKAKWRDKWLKRWLKIAEKFKEAK